MITLTLMSLVTSVKDYVEITHKLIEIEPLKNYTEFGAVFTYFIFSIGDFFKNFFSFSLFKNIWSIPAIAPDIASAMISEVSVLDGYFHNAFTFLETNINTSTNSNLLFFEKFVIGLINSIFLILPTSTSHLITLRRFVMQGLEAGYLAGLGTIAGNFLWLASIILGWRFFVIPWLSLDIFRYLLGFILLVKYIWDSSKERRMALEDLSKWKIFLLNFLLTLTEQSCIYPFISNLSIGPDASILEGFPVENYSQFLIVHGAYLLGILLGSFSLLQFTCWFWENPAFSMYLWITTKSSVKISTSSYYKILNFTFLYATMLCAIASIPYYGLDYTITNPIGLVPQDRILEQKQSQSNPDKLITETAFLGINPTDKNARIRDGVHARRERWKQRLIKYQAFDASMYDQGLYDFLTIEDLNYGFDRFWLRRKMRNHQIRFRLFPGPWMRSLKKQLNNPTNPSADNKNKAASGPRVEFFRILFEQFYHPNFHQGNSNKLKKINNMQTKLNPNVRNLAFSSDSNQTQPQGYFNSLDSADKQIQSGLIQTNSALRKYVRNVNTRVNLKLLNNKENTLINKSYSQLIYSKRWKSLFSKLQPLTKTQSRKSYQLFRNVAKQLLLTPDAKSLKLTSINQKVSIKERKLLHLRSNKNQLRGLNPSEGKIQNLNNSLNLAFTGNSSVTGLQGNYNTIASASSIRQEEKLLLVRPLNIYLQKDQAFKRKLRYYGSTTMRKLTVGNQAPYFKALMKRGFYFYKPSLRWKKTLYVASMRRGFRKKSRKQRVLLSNTFESSDLRLSSKVRESLEMSTLNPVTMGSGTTTVDLGLGNKQNTTVKELNLAYAQESPPKNQGGTSPNTTMNIQITPPTHSYSVLGKRASRYRHQIYKDVLQHWYYTPFNRLLLKFDVDAFINRQPKTHFLTKNDERILHIRRFLLSEHYDTLRWYTYMQHYKTMKTNIGGTKSFANRSYNQQFQGTFKKIRHLFAITPKQGDLYTLKYDQPLYNDNKLKDNVYFHEELIPDNYSNQSNNIFQEEKKIKKEVMSFLAESKIINENPSLRLSVKQESLSSNTINPLVYPGKNLDLISQTSNLISNQPSNLFNGMTRSFGSEDNQTNNFKFIYNELFVKLIKECKKRINDQTFLKNYITYRMEKREQLNQEQVKELNKRLEKLKIFGSSAKKLTNQQKQNKQLNQEGTTNENKVLTTGMQKAVTDSLNQIVLKNNPAPQAIELQGFTPLNKATYSELNNAYTIQNENLILNKLNTINLLTNQIKNQNKIDLSFVSTNLEKTKKLLQNTINTFKPILLKKTQLLQTKTDKNLQWWREKQRVITKRKNSRKRDRFKKQIAVVNKKLKTLSEKVNKEKSNLYKTLYGSYGMSDYLAIAQGDSQRVQNPSTTLLDSTVLTKKQDDSLNEVNLGLVQRLNNQEVNPKQRKLVGVSSGFIENPSSMKISSKSNIWQDFFSKKLRKKVSSKGRRYRSLSLARYLTATRKPRFVGIENFTKIDNITNPQGSFLTKEEKQQSINLAIKNEINNTSSLYKVSKVESPFGLGLGNTLKKSQIKKRTRHSWKKRARHQFSRNHYKYRKRHIHGNGKLRVMNKKLKKVKETNELRQWWWSSFLPRYLNNLPTITTKVPTGQAFPVDTNIPMDFKPLSNRDNSIITDKITYSKNKDNASISNIPATQLRTQNSFNGVGFNEVTMDKTNINSSNFGDKFLNKLDSGKLQNNNQGKDTNSFMQTMTGTTTNLPFYAGWDESLRKFVVTNRLLSRRDTSLEVKDLIFNKEAIARYLVKGLEQMPKSQEILFTNTPIQGLNEGSFLYWQTDMPFNAYNIDQFITTNQSFYAPLGWRRFEFRHLILKTWINNAKISVKTNQYKTLIVSMKNLQSLKLIKQKQENIKTKKLIARRIKKRYKLLKQMPNQLMYSPTGPLLTEVLPSHYISVFDQQYRFPRNRYLKRNTLKTLKKTTLLAMVDSYNQTGDKEFTLRKRVKPRRKYHRKRFIKKDGLIFPRRLKLTSLDLGEGSLEENLRWRPSSRSKQKRKETGRLKTKANKRVKTNPLRLRQLRRREFQQILKPVQRYIPQNGGFTWPGDYLRLEVVEMPKLKSTNLKKTSLKQKINVQPVGIMPRKYLIEKHNILVLKKKLEKAYSSHQLSKAIKDYKLLIENQK